MIGSRPQRARVLNALLFLFPLLGTGCPDDGEVAPECTSALDCTPGQLCADGVCTLPDGGSNLGDAAATGLVSLELIPNSAELVIRDGLSKSQGFALMGTYSDGRVLQIPGVFSSDAPTVGSVDPNTGLFTAQGVSGGIVTISANLPRLGATATARVTVRLERTIVVDGTAADAERLFQMTPLRDTARAAGIAYPLNGAVVPQNVFPMDVQWNEGAEGDVFRVTLEKPHASVVAYVSHEAADENRHWLVDDIGWRGLAQTDGNSDVSVSVDRYEADTASVISGDPVQFRFARAAVTGSVYYWDIAAGRIVRINGGTAEREAFMPTPPESREGKKCVGCHTVSNSGRYMAGRLGGANNIGAVFDLSRDLTGDPPPTEYPLEIESPYSQFWWFSSWSPAEDRLAITLQEGLENPLKIMDPFSGDLVAVTGDLPRNAGQPAWSPDGTSIAYAGNLDTRGHTFQHSDLSLLAVGPGDTVGASTTIVQGSGLATATPAGEAISYPSWTLDSQRLIFSHGTGTRTTQKIDDEFVEHEFALYIVNRDGSGLIRLDNASGGPNAAHSYQPHSTPFDSEEYYWVSFLSRRDYGNDGQGTASTGRQQVWVAAIKKNPTPGEDPSEVGYWVPGQSTASRNISAFWAPRACRPDGTECTVDSECCGGTCQREPGGSATVCIPPPINECREQNETCSTTSDCCGALECTGNVCIFPLI